MFKIKKDNTVRQLRYYCALGTSKRKVIYGSSPEVVHKKAVRAIEKGEISFDQVAIPPIQEVGDIDDLPF